MGKGCQPRPPAGLAVDWENHCSFYLFYLKKKTTPNNSLLPWPVAQLVGASKVMGSFPSGCIYEAANQLIDVSLCLSLSVSLSLSHPPSLPLSQINKHILG